MVKKETIGKIQLGIGIVLLLISLTGIIISFSNYIGHSTDIINFFSLNFSGYSNEIDALGIILFKINILIASILLFIISLLSITQGLANAWGDKQSF